MDYLLSDVKIRAAIKRVAATAGEEWLSDSHRRGAGKLQLRVMPSGAMWYFRYTYAKNKRHALPLGHYATARSKSEHTGASFSLQEARQKAAEYAELLKDPATRNIRAYLDEQQRKREAQERERARLESRTLGDLANAYADLLEARGQGSAENARSTLRVHVIDAHPTLASLPAAEIKRADVMHILRTLVDSGKAKRAVKVRAFLRSAFAVALAADSDSSIPQSFTEYRIESNPVADTAVPAAEEREPINLTRQEFREYLLALADSKTEEARAIEICIFGGGQRPQQVIRAPRSAADLDNGTLTIKDMKGRRKKPREHVIPFAEAGAEMLARVVSRSDTLGSDYLFTLTGANPLSSNSVSKFSRDLVKKLLKSGRVERYFQLRDIRRTCETMLAMIGVSRDLRAQLLSHGLSGVQVRYDKHEYFMEKRTTLSRWEQHLLALTKGATTDEALVMMTRPDGSRSVEIDLFADTQP